MVIHLWSALRCLQRVSPTLNFARMIKISDFSFWYREIIRDECIHRFIWSIGWINSINLIQRIRVFRFWPVSASFWRSFGNPANQPVNGQGIIHELDLMIFGWWRYWGYAEQCMKSLFDMSRRNGSCSNPRNATFSPELYYPKSWLREYWRCCQREP
jgi:hypothetical protein